MPDIISIFKLKGKEKITREKVRQGYILLLHILIYVIIFFNVWQKQRMDKKECYMKFAHISDLHLGMRIFERKIAEDQKYILGEIVKILKKEKPDGVFISGDIYDRPVPPEESVDMLNDFLSQIHSLGQDIYIISGNHDSPERIGFGSDILHCAGVYVAGKYNGKLCKVTKSDEFGKINIFLLPYIKPSFVNNLLSEEDKIPGLDHETAVRMALETTPPDKSERNILLAHQFVYGATRMDSEEIIVGMIDAISDSVFDDYDYVALGHLHKRQFIKREEQVYCGTPLKYSFKEEKVEKYVTFVQMGKKGDLDIYDVPLKPLRDMKNLRGRFDELMKDKCDDFLRIVLTDETIVPYAFNRLRERYPNVLKIEYENTKDFASLIKTDVRMKTKKPEDLFAEFFEKCTGRKMGEDEMEIMEEVIH